MQWPAATPAGTVVLLPVLDPCLQGYRDRERFLDSRHRRFVIDSAATILLDGRVAGVWDLVAGRSPELRLCFPDAPDAGRAVACARLPPTSPRS